MRVLVSYDVSDDRVRTKVAAALEGFLTRVQYSVFEGEAPEESLKERIGRLLPLIDSGSDSIRVYRLCAACAGRLDVYGRRVDPVPRPVTVL